jgi:hypothetical protein
MCSFCIQDMIQASKGKTASFRGNHTSVRARYDLHCNRLCQKDLQKSAFGASVVQILRLSDLHAGQIIGSRGFA